MNLDEVGVLKYKPILNWYVVNTFRTELTRKRSEEGNGKPLYPAKKNLDFK